YAKLSVLDEENAPIPCRSIDKSRSRKLDGLDATQAYLFNLEDPYAKLSVIPPEEPVDLLWKTRTDVYGYISGEFALPLFRTRPPPLLRQLGEKVIRLS